MYSLDAQGVYKVGVDIGATGGAALDNAQVDQPLSLRLAFSFSSSIFLPLALFVLLSSNSFFLTLFISLFLYICLSLSYLLSLFPLSRSSSLGIVPSFSFLSEAINPSLLRSLCYFLIYSVYFSSSTLRSLSISFSLSL